MHLNSHRSNMASPMLQEHPHWSQTTISQGDTCKSSRSPSCWKPFHNTHCTQNKGSNPHIPRGSPDQHCPPQPISFLCLQYSFSKHGRSFLLSATEPFHELFPLHESPNRTNPLSLV
jgi:hypothetical protein